MGYNMVIFEFKCHTCGKRYQRDEVRYLCPYCSPEKIPHIPLKGVLEVDYDYQEIKRLWNPKKPDLNLFSCVEKEYYPPVIVGETPFQAAPRLAKQLGYKQLFLKNDSLSLSGSLKDRASFLVVAEANRLGIDTIITASTGNAACALAAVCAAANKKAVIFVPASAPIAKLTQLRLYGADLKIVDGNYDDAYRESLIYSQKNTGLNRNTAYNPLTIEGKKSVSLEIFLQNDQNAPDVIFVPVGDGVIIAGVYKGFYDLKEAGLIRKIPRLIAVQAENSDAIHHFFQTGNYSPSSNPKTKADSISVINPGNAYQAVDFIKKSHGTTILVSDNEIMSAQKILAETTGVYAEPAAAASLAGLIKVSNQNIISKDDQIVLLITGHGLKDIEATINYLKCE